jgi:hypothetical protein
MLYERDVWLLDQVINERGVQVDTLFAARAAVIVGELTEQLNRIPELQAYPIRWLKQRYRLSSTYAAFVAAELRWEGA